MCVRSLMRGAVVLLFGLPVVLAGSAPEPAFGADGTWNAAAHGNWSDAGNWLGGTVADGSGNTAYFNAVDVPGGGITATLDTGRVIGNLAFGDTNTGTAGNWLLSGPNTLTLAGGTPSVTVEQLGVGATATIATAVAGSSGLTKAGAGTLALTGTNNYTGGTTITAGTLKGTINSIRGDVLVNAGAVVEFADPPTNTIANKITGDGLFRVFFTGQSHVWITGLTDFTGTIQLSKAVANKGKWTASGIGTLDAALIVDNLCQIYVAGQTTFNKGITVSGIGNTEYRGAIRLASTLGGNISLVGDTTVGAEDGTITGTVTSGIAGTQVLTFAGVDVNHYNATVSGAISDGAGIIAVTQNRAGGILTLSGNNTYSGVTTISAGTLQVGTGGATGTLGSGNVVNNGALVFNRSGELTVANDISGTGSLAKQGDGTVTLTGNNSYNGGTTVGGGALVGTVGSIRGTVQVATGATVQFNATETGEVPNTIAGDGVLRLHLVGGGHTIMNKVSGITGTIWVSNTGTPVTNKWSVTQSVNADAAVLLDPGSTLFVFGGQTASFGKGITLSGTGNTENRGAIRLGGTLGGNVTLAGSTTVGGEGGTIAGDIASGVAGTQTLTFAGSGNGNATVSGAISDGAGTVAVTQNRAGGTLTLTGNNSYTGPTTISAGTVQVGAGGATGTLGSGDVVNNGSLVFNRSGELTATNRISGTGGVTKQGTGALTLSGTSTYGGATRIQGGILRLTPPTANPVTDGLTWSLDASDGSHINTGTPADGDLVTTWTAIVGPAIGQTTTDRHPTYRADVQNGLSAVRFDGIDDRLFSSTGHADVNTIFIVNAPAVQEGSGGKGIVGGTGQGGTLADKGVRRINGTNFWQQRSPGSADDFAYPTGSQIRVNGVVTNAFAAEEFHLLTATRNDEAMKFNAVGGYYDGRAYKGDVGEILAFDRILTPAEIDAVEAYLNAKWFGVGHVLPANTAVTIDDGAGLEVIGVGQTVGSLAGASGSSVLLDNATLVVGGNNASTVFAGAITGDGGLTKTGAGTLTLSGASDYTGATTVNAGRLFVTGALGQSAVAVNDGGTLGGSGTIGGAVTVNGSGWLSPGTSPGVLTMGSLALEPDSTTLMEINGVQRGEEYDGVNITAGGDLAYGGTLSLLFGNSTPFLDGSTFDLFSFASGVPGTFFDEVTSTGYYEGTWTWDNADTFSLEFGRQTLLFSHLTGELTIVPEPSAFVLAVLALAAMAFRRPRRPIDCQA